MQLNCIERKMIDVPIPKDILKYEARVVGPLSLRQTLCGGIAIVLSLIFYTLIGKPFNLSNDAMFFGCFIFSIIPLCVGWIKPYGMNFENFAKVAFFTIFVFPKKRIYKTVNSYDKNQKPISKTNAQKNKITKAMIQQNQNLEAFQ